MDKNVAELSTTHKAQQVKKLFNRRMTATLSAARQWATSSVRQQVHSLFEDPSSSLAARVITGLMMGLIVLSVAAMCVETIYPFGTTYAVTFHGIEIVCVIGFTTDFVVRALTAPKLAHFFSVRRRSGGGKAQL